MIGHSSKSFCFNIKKSCFYSIYAVKPAATTTSIKRLTLSVSKKIPVQFLLYKTTTCISDERPLKLVFKVKKSLFKTTANNYKKVLSQEWCLETLRTYLWKGSNYHIKVASHILRSEIKRAVFIFRSTVLFWVFAALYTPSLLKSLDSLRNIWSEKW